MGCINANNRDVFYSQEKNAIETYNRYEKAHDGLDHYTETCGPTSWWNGFNAMGVTLNSRIRIADEVFCWMNEPQNFTKFPAWTNENGDQVNPGDVPSNQVQAWIPIAGKILYGADSIYHEGVSFDDIVAMLNQGHAVQLARRIGHFICAVDYDQANDSLIYWDSFHLLVVQNADGTESFVDDGTNGFRRSVKRADFQTFCYSRVVEMIGVSA